MDKITQNLLLLFTHEYGTFEPLPDLLPRTQNKSSIVDTSLYSFDREKIALIGYICRSLNYMLSQL
jgi:hypothetical protein